MFKKRKTGRSKQPSQQPKKQQQQQKSLEFFVYGKKNGNAREGVVVGKETKQGKIKWLGQVDLRKQKEGGGGVEDKETATKVRKHHTCPK